MRAKQRRKIETQRGGEVGNAGRYWMGLAIALASAALAVEHIRLGRPADAYLAAARQLTAIPIRLASIVSGLARSSGGRNLMLGAAACAPGLIGTIVRRTRLTLAAERF